MCIIPSPGRQLRDSPLGGRSNCQVCSHRARFKRLSSRLADADGTKLLPELLVYKHLFALKLNVSHFELLHVHWRSDRFYIFGQSERTDCSSSLHAPG